MNFRKTLRATVAGLFTVLSAASMSADNKLVNSEWNEVEQQAAGQTVYFNAWGGDNRTNDYINWLAAEVKRQFDIELVHVKLSDTAEAVSRVLAEKQAGNTNRGAVDLVWINGENFASMKQAGLLYGPWAEDVPNFPLTNPDESPAVRTDFTVPVDGYELPWGKAQLVFYYDKALTENPPKTIPQLLKWSKSNKGEFSYAKPPQFLGTTFLKQALIELAEDSSVLSEPVSEADFEAVTKPLWRFLDELHPQLWRSGRAFPESGPAMRQLMADGELSLAYSFNTQEAAGAIAANELPASVETYVLDGGTLGNFSFVGIPFNASHPAGAMVVANFMLSPEAQARKQDATVWGNSTVLSLEKLTEQQRALFEKLPQLPGAASTAELEKVIAEPHPSWVEALEQAWLKRYVGS
ncbi:ABC transporter substrate-binding protein [Allohahella marinimesophila]|uniref:ABC transporter substrate-binding protein n=1 Tax=Allohahella marinimesophila TaxID=1054972 RepID=A0ABP7NNA5_9GAMM